MNEYGPGTTLLARLTGNDVEEVATKPAVAIRAVAGFAKDMARLAADRSSPDEGVRVAAERRAAEIKALVDAAPPPDARAAKARFQAGVEDALRKVLRDLDRA